MQGRRPEAVQKTEFMEAREGGQYTFENGYSKK